MLRQIAGIILSASLIAALPVRPGVAGDGIAGTGAEIAREI